MWGRAAVRRAPAGLREAEPNAAGQQSPSWAGTAGVATAAMAASTMLALYAVSALGPSLAHDMQLPRSAVATWRRFPPRSPSRRSPNRCSGSRGPASTQSGPAPIQVSSPMTLGGHPATPGPLHLRPPAMDIHCLRNLPVVAQFS